MNKLKLIIPAVIAVGAVVATPTIIKAKDTTVTEQPLATPEPTTSTVDQLPTPTVQAPISTPAPTVAPVDKPKPTVKPTPTPEPQTEDANGSIYLNDNPPTTVIVVTPKPHPNQP